MESGIYWLIYIGQNFNLILSFSEKQSSHCLDVGRNIMSRVKGRANYWLRDETTANSNFDLSNTE